jgi:type II secretory pathway component PulF
MKKVKLVVWILIVVFAVVVIYQNKDFFWETKKSLTINLPLLPEQYKTLPEVELLFIFGIFFAAGLLLGIYLLISRGLKKKKLVKSLKAQVKEQTEKADALEEELRALRGDPVLPDTSGNADTVLQATGTNPGGQPPTGDNKS